MKKFLTVLSVSSIFLASAGSYAMAPKCDDAIRELQTLRNNLGSEDSQVVNWLNNTVAVSLDTTANNFTAHLGQMVYVDAGSVNSMRENANQVRQTANSFSQVDSQNLQAIDQILNHMQDCLRQ